MSKKKKTKEFNHNSAEENINAKQDENIQSEHLKEELDNQQEFVKESDLEKDKTVEEQSKEDEWKDKYLRVLAEFDNYKKRTAKEKEMIYDDAVMDTVSKVLPVLDSFQSAMAVEVSSDDAKNVLKGIDVLKRQLDDILEKIGVKEIEAVGKEFDPQLHNAVMHVEDDNYGANIVVEEFSTGYLYKDKVIRHSMVKVAN